MSFYPCYRCGSLKHSTKNCALCGHCYGGFHPYDSCPEIECRYCHKNGHTISVCPRLEPCSTCEKRGHRTQDCRDAHYSKPKDKEANGITSRSLSYVQTNLARETTGPSRAVDHQQKSKPFPEEGLSHSCPTMWFPNMKETLLQVTRTLFDEKIPELASIRYKSHIQNLGGINQVVHDALSYIDPEVLALEGKPITRTCLLDLKRYQASNPALWTNTTCAGYVNFILDNRDLGYLRFYVGQSNQAYVRIRSHIMRIQNGADDTLHYHILRMGAGHRTGNFLRLWVYPLVTTDCDVKLEEQKRAVFQNILESAFCRVFHSLPPNILTQYFGPCDDLGGYLTTGLNVVPPTLQDHIFDVLQLYRFKLDLSESLDPEIQQWPEIRKQQYLELTKLRPVPSTPRFEYEDYVNATSAALGCEISSFLESTRAEYKKPRLMNLDVLSELDITGQFNINKEGFACPVGSLSAKIGIVLEVGFLKSESTAATVTDCDQNFLDLPWGLKECGLTSHNSLTWTWNFRQNLDEPMLNLAESGSLTDSTSGMSRCLIQASDLRIILLCGIGTERDILKQSNRGHIKGPFRLRLRRFVHHIHAEFVNGCVVRLYISCPSPFSMVGSEKWLAAKKFGEVIQFTGHLTATDTFHYSAYESRFVYSRIIGRHKLEAMGYPKMMPTDIEPGIHSWLYDKGFQDVNDMMRLEKAAGSLTLGLMMLLGALPRRPSGKGKSIPLEKKANKKRKFSQFSPDAFQAVKDLYTELHNALIATPAHRDVSVNSADLGTTRSLIGSATNSSGHNTARDGFEDDFSESRTLTNEIPDQSGSVFVESGNGIVDLLHTIGEETLEEACIFNESEKGTLKLSIPAIDRNTTKKRVHPGPMNTDLRTALLTGTAVFQGMNEKLSKARRITIRHVSLNINQPFVGAMTVKAELSAVETMHPNAFTPQAGRSNPASRLAYRVTGQDSNGKPLIEWPIKLGMKAVPKIAQIVEWLT